MNREWRVKITRLACAAGCILTGVARTATAQVLHEQTIDTPGKLCILRSEGPVAWLPIQPADWQTSVHDGGKTCVVATHAAGTVVLIAIHAAESGTLPQVDRWVVNIGGPGPGPVPPPGPGPEPDVIPTDVTNTYGVGHATYRAAKAVGDAATAIQLASDVFEACAAKLSVAADTAKTLSDAQTFIAQRMATALDSKTQWDAFRGSLTDALNAAMQANRGWTRKELEGVCREIALALRAATR